MLQSLRITLHNDTEISLKTSKRDASKFPKSILHNYKLVNV